MTPPQESALHVVSSEFARRDSGVSELAESESDTSHTSPLPSPADLRRNYSLSTDARGRIQRTRAHLRARIEHGVGAPLAIVGPCSIHCESAARKYAERLSALQKTLGDRVHLLMRVYFEKPRTTVGWKGFLYDPDVDGSHDLEKGLARARRLMVQIAEMGVPIATEILDPLATEYIEDCLSWVAIGARTAESQIHRQLASGLDCPVGFKNGTDGSVTVAVQASQAAAEAHTHLGIDRAGQVALRRTKGNTATHVVLRGGNRGPNFDVKSITEVGETLQSQGRRPAVLVDCSHGNSEKDFRRQPEVARAVIAQMRRSHADVMGLMLESHLKSGKQASSGPLDYGVSITDGCIDFATTEALVREMVL